jgi:DNA mismatch repair ATPase MutS
MAEPMAFAPEANATSLMALVMSKHTVGLAAYREDVNTIYADSIQITPDDTEEIMTKIKFACHPKLFLLHPRVMGNKPLLDAITAGTDGSGEAYKYKIMKTASWNPDAATELMYNKLHVKRAGGAMNAAETNRLWITSAIDTENVHIKQAMGALLSFMQTNTFHLDDGNVIVADLQNLHLDSYMRLDDCSIRALQIFKEEIHPNVIKGSGRSKEGFSLFSVFDRTSSALGRSKLAEWMQKPFCDMERINKRLNGVGFTAKHENREFVKELMKLLRKVFDIPHLLLRIKKVESTAVEWCRLYATIQMAMPIVEAMIMFAENVRDSGMENALADANFIDELIAPINIGVIKALLARLQDAIDYEASAESGVLSLKYGYDNDLDRYRDVYNNLERELTSAAHRVLDLCPLLQRISVEYVPQVRKIEG